MRNSVNQCAYRYNDAKKKHGVILLHKLCQLHFVNERKGQQTAQKSQNENPYSTFSCEMPSVYSTFNCALQCIQLRLQNLITEFTASVLKFCRIPVNFIQYLTNTGDN